MGENVEMRCGHGEIILMKEATFGRMKVGKCIKRDLGFLGCKKNVIRKMDSLCTGTSQCQMVRMFSQDFSDVGQEEGQCEDDMSQYLKTEHICVKGKMG